VTIVLVTHFMEEAELRLVNTIPIAPKVRRALRAAFAA
jgi:hypothetical protein